jgi:hypothetical protein
LPSYWPQFEHAVCGSFIWPQARFGHGTSVGALVFHCDRRERVLLREVFRFGTAMSVYSCVASSCSARSAKDASAAQRGSGSSCV